MEGDLEVVTEVWLLEAPAPHALASMAVMKLKARSTQAVEMGTASHYSIISDSSRQWGRVRIQLPAGCASARVAKRGSVSMLTNTLKARHCFTGERCASSSSMGAAATAGGLLTGGLAITLDASSITSSSSSSRINDGTAVVSPAVKGEGRFHFFFSKT